MKQEDINIIQLLQSQDEKAMELIYDRWADALYGMALQICKDQKIAEDVLQESLIKVWKNASKYNPKKAQLFTWIYRITKNQAIDAFRKSQKSQVQNIQKDASFVSIYTSEDLLTSTELSKHINNLESKYKEVLIALFYSGYTQNEWSEKSGIPLGTIKTRLRIGLRELRKIYGSIAMVSFLIWIYYGA